MTSMDKVTLLRIKKLEKTADDHDQAIHLCLDLIDGLDKYCNENLKTSTPPKVQKKWDNDRLELLKLAKEHIKGKKGKRRSRTRKTKR